jgi:hypothetical protein
MLMGVPEILMGKIGFCDEEDEHKNRHWEMKKENPTPEEQEAFEKFVKTWNEVKESMLVVEED